jgi:hypothetical protein
VVLVSLAADDIYYPLLHFLALLVVGLGSIDEMKPSAAEK